MIIITSQARDRESYHSRLRRSDCINDLFTSIYLNIYILYICYMHFHLKKCNCKELWDDFHSFSERKISCYRNSVFFFTFKVIFFIILFSRQYKLFMQVNGDNQISMESTKHIQLQMTGWIDSIPRRKRTQM